MIKNVVDLEIYCEALNLLPKLYTFLNKIAYSERFLVDQSKRAGTSIPANIAEGFSKRIYEKEFKRYLLIALASCDELLSHLRTMALIMPEFSTEINELMQTYTVLAKKINKAHSVWKFLPTSSDFI